MFIKRTLLRTLHDGGEPTGGTTLPVAASPAPAAPAAGAAPPVTPAAPSALPKEVEDELARLRKVEADAKKATDDAETAKLDEIGKAKKAADAHQAEAIAARRENAALKFGLPEEMASRLTGTTKDEIEADAKKLSDLLKVPAKPANTGTPAAGDPPPAGSATEVQAKQKELDDAIKAGKRMDVLRLERELTGLKAKQKA